MTNELPLYQIVEYSKYFENFKSRQVDVCSFVCVPNKHGGQGLTSVLDRPHGVGIYGIWVLILEFSSRQRKPREGYLTADGKKGGARICAAEWARMFWCTPAEVRRALGVLASPEVGFIRLEEGMAEVPEARQNFPDTESDTKADTKSDTESDTKSDTVSILNSDAEGRKEGRNTLLAEPSEAETADTKPDTESDTKADTEPDTKADTKADTKSDTVSIGQATAIFGKLSEDVFGEPLAETQWPYDMQRLLADTLPKLRPEGLKSIDWFYRLPADHRIFKITARRQSLASVIQNLQSEVQKIRSARQRIGLTGSNGATPPPREEDLALTPAQVTVAKRIYGDDVPLPPRWGQLSPSVQREIAGALEATV